MTIDKATLLRTSLPQLERLAISLGMRVIRGTRGRLYRDGLAAAVAWKLARR